MSSLRVRSNVGDRTIASPIMSSSQLEMKSLREKYRNQKDKVTLFQAPLLTLRLFGSYIVLQCDGFRERISVYHKEISYLCVAIVLTCLSLLFDGPHQQVISDVWQFLYFASYWIGLGILSSVMVGTGLHTFLLFLGPHIGKVTLAATECKTVQLLEVAYDVFHCPSISTHEGYVTLWQIFRRVQLEAFLWGFGTALGELPPYFVARAARLAGGETEEEAELEHVTENDPFFLRAKAYCYKNIKNFGFLGIMLFASIPNPLFDLAGIACGHFLVPFQTFFGATMIGKAFFKAHFQALFVIILFNKSTLDRVLGFIEYYVPSAKGTLNAFVQSQLAQYHGGGEALVTSEVSFPFLCLMLHS
eukprot:TRINITY_DN12547_c0_g1_i3.p1 TRINITY_DN12547_c0_g1~~TRINITY_DN12547_c0_g1_i3.p1  ORF type:complete len:360 (-),score=68.16 TRINITY_DN12547_c0_g1_i3:180-1259(-)